MPACDMSGHDALSYLNISSTHGTIVLDDQMHHWHALFSWPHEDSLVPPYHLRSYSSSFSTLGESGKSSWMEALQQVHSWLWTKWTILQDQPSALRPTCDGTPQRPGEISYRLMHVIKTLLRGSPSMAWHTMEVAHPLVRLPSTSRKRTATENCVIDSVIDGISDDSMISMLQTRAKHRKVSTGIAFQRPCNGCQCQQPHNKWDSVQSFLSAYEPAPLTLQLTWHDESYWAKGRVLHRFSIHPLHHLYYDEVIALPHSDNLAQFQGSTFIDLSAWLPSRLVPDFHPMTDWHSRYAYEAI